MPGKCSSKRATDFVVGDRVRFVFCEDLLSYERYAGRIGTVRRIVADYPEIANYRFGSIVVQFDEEQNPNIWYPQRFEKI